MHTISNTTYVVQEMFLESLVNDVMEAVKMEKMAVEHHTSSVPETAKAQDPSVRLL